MCSAQLSRAQAAPAAACQRATGAARAGAPGAKSGARRVRSAGAPGAAPCIAGGHSSQRPDASCSAARSAPNRAPSRRAAGAPRAVPRALLLAAVCLAGLGAPLPCSGAAPGRVGDGSRSAAAGARAGRHAAWDPSTHAAARREAAAPRARAARALQQLPAPPPPSAAGPISPPAPSPRRAPAAGAPAAGGAAGAGLTPAQRFGYGTLSRAAAQAPVPGPSPAPCAPLPALLRLLLPRAAAPARAPARAPAPTPAPATRSDNITQRLQRLVDTQAGPQAPAGAPAGAAGAVVAPGADCSYLGTGLGADEAELAQQRGLLGRAGAAVPVLDTSAFPFSAVGLLIANQATNSTTGRVIIAGAVVGTCSASLVSPFHALTAAHCVDLLWPDISGLPIRDLRLGNFTFVPGLSGACTVPLQAARVLNARVPAAYAGCTSYTGCGLQHDYALLTLDRAIGDQVPPNRKYKPLPLGTALAGYLRLLPAANLTGGPAVFTAGYPYHPPSLDGMDMVFSACGAGAYDSSIELTACGVYEGQSGAPWWVRLDAVTTERYQVAIQSGYVNTTLPAIVIGPRLAGYGGTETLISDAVSAQLHAWLSEDGAVLGAGAPVCGAQGPASGPALAP